MSEVLNYFDVWCLPFIYMISISLKPKKNLVIIITRSLFFLRFIVVVIIYNIMREKFK